MIEQPKQIGSYEVVKELGHGGMGVVYLARDAAIDRLVAIKLLRDGLDEPDTRERFKREARSAGRLRHANIVTIFHVGEHESQPYIVMEYIPGDTLADLIRNRTPYTVVGKLKTIEELCSGLAYAHKYGIVHRDIKPANVIVDSEGDVKILDFGIARIGEPGLTRVGTVMGTPSYMAPEQLSPGIADHRSDVYAVGLVLYEFLTYHRAFSGDSFAIIHKILSSAPAPVEQFCPDIDPAIVDIVGRALDKNPDARYQDLNGMRGDLARVRERLTLQALNQETIALSWPSSGPAAADGPTEARTIGRTVEVTGTAKVDQLFMAAKAALAADDPSKAMELCDQIFAFKSQHEGAAQLMVQIRGRLNLRQGRELLQSAQAEFARHQLAAAAQLIDHALGLDLPADDGGGLKDSLESLRGEVKAAQERIASFNSAIEEARAELSQGALDAARRAIKRASDIDADNSGVQALQADVVEAESVQQAKIRERTLVEAIASAKSRAAANDFDGALATVQKQDAADPRVKAAVADILRLQEEAKAREAEARAKAEALKRKAAADKAAAEAAEQAKIREQALVEAIAGAKSRAAANDFDGALATVQKQDASDPRVKAAVTDILRLQQEARARQEEEARVKAEALKRKAEADKAAAEAARQAKIREQALVEAIASARSRAAANDFDGALAAVQKQDGADPRVKAAIADILRVQEEVRAKEEEARAKQAAAARAKEEEARVKADALKRKAYADKVAAEIMGARTAAERGDLEAALTRLRAIQFNAPDVKSDALTKLEREAGALITRCQVAELVRQARVRLGDGALEDAGNLLERARGVDQQDPQIEALAVELTAAQEALQAKRRRDEVQRLVGDARAAIDANDLEVAETHLAAAARIDPKAPAIQKARTLLKEALARKAATVVITVPPVVVDEPRVSPEPEPTLVLSSTAPAHAKEARTAVLPSKVASTVPLLSKLTRTAPMLGRQGWAAAAVVAVVVLGGFWWALRSPTEVAPSASNAVTAPPPAAEPPPAAPPTASPTAPVQPPPSQAAAPASTPAAPASAPDVGPLRRRFASALARNDSAAALQALSEASRLKPDDAGVGSDADRWLSTLQGEVEGSLRQASQAPAGSQAAVNYRIAARRRDEAANFVREGKKIDAASSLVLARDILARASSPARAETPARDTPAVTRPQQATEPQPQAQPTQVTQQPPSPEQPPQATPAVRPPPQPPQSESAPPRADATAAADRAAIEAVLRDYVDAYQRLDAGGVRRVWPSAPDSVNFRQVRSYSLALANTQIMLQGDRATVTCQRQIKLQPTAGREQTANPRTVFSLQRSASGWIITAVQ